MALSKSLCCRCVGEFANANNTWASPLKQIVYIYNANRQKLKKIIIVNGSVTETTDYLSGFQYIGSVLQFFPTAEGYVSNIR